MFWFINIQLLLDHVIATNSNVNNGIRTQQHKKFTSSWLSPLKFLLSDFESELQYDEPQKPLASVFCGSSQVISSMKTPIMPSAMRCGPMSSLQCEVNRNPEREAGNGGSVLILVLPLPTQFNKLHAFLISNYDFDFLMIDL